MKPSFLIDNLKIIILAAILAAGIGSLGAWSDPPTGTPPSCPLSNPACNPPVHTGSQSQSKAGGLDLGSLTVGGQSVLYGNVGVGLSYPATPQVPLEVSGKTKTTKLEVTSNTFLATDGVGQVGINVPNPRNRLDVGGKIKSSEDVCIALSGGGEKCMATLPSLGPEVVISTTVVDLGWHHICFMVGDVDDDVGTHEKRLFLDPANPGQTAQGKYHWLGVSNSVRSGFFVRCLDLF